MALLTWRDTSTRELIKPRPWAFNAGLTAPEWRWFWDALLWADLTWSPNGNGVFFVGRDAAIHQAGHTIDAGAGSISTQYNTAGPGWNFSASDSRVLVTTSVSGDDPFTFFAVASFTSTAFEVLGGIAESEGPTASVLNILRTDNGALSGTIRTNPTISTTTISGGANAHNDGMPHGVAFSWGGASDGSMMLAVDGVIEATGSQTGSFTDANWLGYGTRNYDGSWGPNFSGTINLFGHLNRACSAGELRALSRDPFGPFRMRDEFPEIAPEEDQTATQFIDWM